MVWLAACVNTDGEVGLTTLAVVNESDEALAIDFTPGNVAVPVVLATEVAAGATADVIEQGGCFGCADAPEAVVTTFTVSDASGTVVLHLDPVTREDWTSAELGPDPGAYDARYTLTVTQGDVDAAQTAAD
jgi:hypothetical protein